MPIIFKDKCFLVKDIQVAKIKFESLFFLNCFPEISII